MRAMFGLVLLAGVGLAGGAVYMTKGYVSQTQTALAQERSFREMTGPLVRVFVVNKDLNYGQPLTKKDVQTIFWQKNMLPDGVFEKAAELFPDDGKTPRYVLHGMQKFTPVLALKVTKPGEPAGLTGQLNKGERAFTISVNATTGVSGFIQPGSHVDVYWTGSVGGEQGEMTRLIESALRVIAVDQKAAGQSTTAQVARTVTVASTPENIGRLAQAQATGKLSLSLVGSSDEAVTGKVSVDTQQLLGLQKPVPVVAAPTPVAPKTCTIKTMRGTELVDTPIPCTN